jgi:hypothetical protein
VFIKTVSKLVIIVFCIYLCQNNKKKPTELIQVGLLFYLLKKQDLISTLALPPETFTLVEFVPF